ncbi:MAG: class I tRNA ligase family protein [bacterium]|nr:class I tRNA ligase family protein [bacterium]
MFDSVDPKQSLPDLEEGLLQYWQEEDIFKRSMKQRGAWGNDILENKTKDNDESKNGNVFSFYDGPPFATGQPHYGHILAGTIKDVIPRYRTMRGDFVQRRFGWDCHGLPIENLIEQENNIGSKTEIEEMGVKKFNDLCRDAVQRYTSDWRRVVERMGRWVDMDWDYKTMDPEYMESMWWAFEQLHKKDLIYEGHKPMHVCPRCVTPLSNFEVTQGYQDITDQSVTASFKVVDVLEGIDVLEVYVLAWTTTPWTLPGNLLLAVHPKVTYAQVLFDGAMYILAEDLVDSPQNFKDKEYEIVGTMKGKELIGKTYTPLFPYFASQYKDTAFKIVAGDFVTTEDGTGVVHIAPGFGEDDYRTGQEAGLELLQHITMDGKFVDGVTDFAGQDVKPKDDPSKTDRKVIELLEKNGSMFSKTSYKHSYPHCWRCDSPLLNYATSSWFVQVEKLKDAMQSNNAKTAWVPSHIRDGRYGKWLEGARDWAISRNRYWGTPLPIWRSDQGDMTVIGSRDALMEEHKIRFTKVTTVRHGESEGNTIPIYQGEVPGTDLTENGIKQVKQSAKLIVAGSGLRVARIYCSPLARAQQTAAAIAKETGAEVVVDTRLREVGFAHYEGKTVDFSDLAFLKERRAYKLGSAKPESIYHFEGMETWASVQERVADFMTEILPLHRSEHIVVVSHADPVLNMKEFFTKEDPIKISHQPYPELAGAHTYFWDHTREMQMDLHKDSVDDITWSGSPCDHSVEVTMVRHGETDWNVQEKIQGSTKDVPLNDNGRKQVAEAAAALKGQHFDLIVSSDLDRCVQTAEILSKELGIPFEHQWDVLQERRYTSWEGKNKAELLEELSADLPLTSMGLHPDTPEEGESLSAFFERMQQACEKLLEEFGGKKVLLVGHGGTNRALRVFAENMSYAEIIAWAPKNAEAMTITLHPTLKRIPEVLDCWFESGSMPFAQAHFPFEPSHKGLKEPPGFPANFIAEGVDQTRSWFYTLMVLSTALFGETPFKNVVVNGIVLAGDGKKMSKKLKNYPDPIEVVDRHGADAVRFALMSSPAVRAEDLRFSEKFVEETVRSVLLPLWNTYSFFVTYANAAGFTPEASRRHSNHPLDRWIRAEVQDLVNRMTTELDNYDLSATCNEIHETIDALTNWYVRLSRRRFAGQGSSEGEQHEALMTLHDVLLTVCQLLAPFCPFITDAIYQNLVEEEHFSIHMTDWPEQKELSKEERSLLEKTRLMRQIVSLGMSVRAESTVKVRQPLHKATIAVPPAMMKLVTLGNDDLALLRQELNVKEIVLSDAPEELAEIYANVDARKVGPRLGKRVQEVIQAGKLGEFTVKDDGSVLILDELLTPEEVAIAYRGKEGENVAADKGVVVSIDTTIDEPLAKEGIARDIIRTIQRLRKDNGYSLGEKIGIGVSSKEDLVSTVLNEHGEMIRLETLVNFDSTTGDTFTEIVGEELTVEIIMQKK